MNVALRKRHAQTMLHRSHWHTSLTETAIVGAVERHMTTLDDPGFCLSCGCEALGVESDARNYECEACGADQVFGAEELLEVA